MPLAIVTRARRLLHRQESVSGRFCCKSPKLSGDNFPAARQSDPRSSIDIASITLARSPVSLSSGDEVPHIFTRNSRVRRIFDHQCKKTFSTASTPCRPRVCTATDYPLPQQLLYPLTARRT